MKSLSLFVFAAFAACVPGTHASDHLTLTKLHPDPQGQIINELSPKDQALYATIDRAAYETMTKRSKAKFENRVQRIFKSLGMQISSEIVASLFNQKREPLVNEQPIFIGDIIKVIGPDRLQGNVQLAKKLVSLALTPSGEPKPLTAGEASSNIIGDPRSLLLLLREDENEKLKHRNKESTSEDEDKESTSNDEDRESTSKDEESKSEDKDEYSIIDLFEQNAEQFKGGLGIDETWIDNGLLGWFTAGLKLDRTYPIRITLSYDDTVALLCHSIFSSSTPPGSKTRLTQGKIAKIMKGMSTLLKSENYPTLETLSKLKTGPLKTDPVAFDFAVGLPGCIAQRPSIYALLDSLVSLTKGGTFANDPQAEILETFATNVGLGAEDLFWMTHRKESAISLSPFKAALVVICDDALNHRDEYVCSKSKYFLNTPGNGVLGWGTLSWVLRKMVERKLYSAISKMLSVLAEFSLLPAQIRAEPEIFKSVMTLLESTKDGTELNELDKEKLENLLRGKEHKEPRSDKGSEESRSGNEPEEPRGGKERKEPRSSRKPKEPQSDKEHKESRSDKSSEESRSGNEPEKPRGGKERKEPRSDKERKEPRSGKKGKKPRSDKERKGPRSGKKP